MLWQASDGGSEICVLERAGRGWRFRGTVLTHEAKEPIELRYAVTVDAAWATTDVDVLVAFAGGDLREPVGLVASAVEFQMAASELKLATLLSAAGATGAVAGHAP